MRPRYDLYILDQIGILGKQAGTGDGAREKYLLILIIIV